MAFKPKRQNSGKSNSNFEYRELPVPKDGTRAARVSLIIDLGIQEREDFENPDGSKKKQEPCQQVAIFADLVNDKVDYGGDIGEQQYRLCLNKTFAGKMQGINFQCIPPKDGDGKTLKPDPTKNLFYQLPPASLITKLCKAVGRPEVAIDNRKNPASLDLEQLLNLPFMADVQVKITEKEMDDGTKRVYKNVNYRGASAIPMIPVLDEDGEPTGDEKLMKVKALDATPRCIQFETATKDDVQFIRYGIRQMIKLAKDYPGSAMQKAIEAWEAENVKQDDGEATPEPKAETPKPTPAKRETKKVETPVAPDGDDDDGDAPF